MKSNEIWHIDTSVVRLLDGSKAYLHAVIDNYSRRILSWKVSSTFNPVATAEILLTASKGMADCKPMLLADGGVENFNVRSMNSSKRECSIECSPKRRSRFPIQ